MTKPRLLVYGPVKVDRLEHDSKIMAAGWCYDNGLYVKHVLPILILPYFSDWRLDRNLENKYSERLAQTRKEKIDSLEDF